MSESKNNFNKECLTLNYNTLAELGFLDFYVPKVAKLKKPTAEFASYEYFLQRQADFQVKIPLQGFFGNSVRAALRRSNRV